MCIVWILFIPKFLLFTYYTHLTSVDKEGQRDLILLLPPVDLDLCRFMVPQRDLLLGPNVLAWENEITLAETEEAFDPEIILTSLWRVITLENCGGQINMNLEK